MFDFAWSEIALIVVVAVVFIGPKDLPIAIKAVTGMLKKARRMAGEFQTHVDDMMKEADLQEVRDSINQIRSFDFKGAVERTVDPDGTMRKGFSDPFVTPPAAAAATEAAAAETSAADPATSDAATFVDERPEPVVTTPADMSESDDEPPPPAFIPPGFALPDYLSPPRAAPAEIVPPAFVPPSVTRPH